MSVSLVGSSSFEATDLSSLATALSPNGWDVTINEGGEVMAQPISSMSQYILGGGVWLDYAGWPFYFYPGQNSNSSGQAGANGWFAFLASLGISGFPMANSGFDTASGNTNSQGFQRALHITEPAASVAGLVASQSAPSWTNTVNGKTVYAYTLFALQAGKGWYFYGSHWYNTSHVALSIYADFVNRVLAAHTAPTATPTGGTPARRGLSPMVVIIGGAALVCGGLFAVDRLL